MARATRITIRVYNTRKPEDKMKSAGGENINEDALASPDRRQHSSNSVSNVENTLRHVEDFA